MVSHASNSLEACNPTNLIHAPHGDDVLWLTSSFGSSRFNPRPRMGGDRIGSLVQARMTVSIHAPAWGATAEPRSLRAGCFDPRPRMGGDERFRRHGDPSSFDPRPRMGGDQAARR